MLKNVAVDQNEVEPTGTKGRKLNTVGKPNERTRGEVTKREKLQTEGGERVMNRNLVVHQRGRRGK